MTIDIGMEPPLLLYHLSKSLHIMTLPSLLLCNNFLIHMVRLWVCHLYKCLRMMTFFPLNFHIIMITFFSWNLGKVIKKMEILLLIFIMKTFFMTIGSMINGDNKGLIAQEDNLEVFTNPDYNNYGSSNTLFMFPPLIR